MYESTNAAVSKVLQSQIIEDTVKPSCLPLQQLISKHACQ